MVEVYKCINKINPEFMWDYFNTKEIPYSLRNGHLLEILSIRTKKYGINTLLFRGSLLWNTIPNEMKSVLSVAIFKHRISSWSGKLRNCASCV